MGWMPPGYLILPPTNSTAKGPVRVGERGMEQDCTRQGTSSRIYTISHIHRYIGSQEEGVGPGSVLLYKKAPVSWTGRPLLSDMQGGPGSDRHRLISRLESHNLALGGSARRRAKKGC